MQNIVKNTDCTNHIKELWKVFTKEGKELFPTRFAAKVKTRKNAPNSF